MTPDELKAYAQSEGERFWRDAGNHWLNDSFDLRSDSRVIEVGGYLGNWTDYVSSRYNCYIEVYEPVNEFFERLRRRFTHQAKINVRRYAVLDVSGETQIALMEEGSTLYTPGALQGPKVPTIDIAAIIGVGCDLLAINAEGAEYSILERLCETGEIAKIKQLLVQFHASHENAESRRLSIKEKLLLTHHDVMCYAFCWERWVRK